MTTTTSHPNDEDPAPAVPPADGGRSPDAPDFPEVPDVPAQEGSGTSVPGAPPAPPGDGPFPAPAGTPRSGGTAPVRSARSVFGAEMWVPSATVKSPEPVAASSAWETETETAGHPAVDGPEPAGGPVTAPLIAQTARSSVRMGSAWDAGAGTGTGTGVSTGTGVGMGDGHGETKPSTDTGPDTGPDTEPGSGPGSGPASKSGTAKGAAEAAGAAGAEAGGSSVEPVPRRRLGPAGRPGGGDGPRWSPLIVGESTQEIPVHLLFRDEPAGARPPTVVRRRWGTSEQPRVRRVPPPVPAAPPAPKPASPSPSPSAPVRVPAPASVAVPAAPLRPAPPVDPRLAERPGPVLPGWAASLVGFLTLIACAALLWWVGAVPDAVAKVLGLRPKPDRGIGLGQWALLAFGGTVMVFAFGGLGRGQVGQAWVLTLFGDYRGSVRRTGLLWVSPLLVRRKVDVRLRHWRSEPMPSVDSNGTALRVVVLVVWRVRDTVRAALGVGDHEEYLREQVEAAMARVLSQLPADAFHDEAPTLRNAEAVGDALTRMLSAECRPVGVDVFSAQPTRIEYAPEIAAAMQRSRIAAIDAKHRDSVLTSVVDAVDDTVRRLTSRGLVELDDYERKVLVKDLTVAFYTGRQSAGERL
ncbi:SPFH domain-containing protein [Streptomyces sp. NBC_00872]|uniref:SPFH domain-containing protein n=1 Tax=Streptomyces sp. NBC_00872 TaxID=2903686 RepID=UPI0038655416|nr:SPFH domain-containing protein [Streptomyces sp. NBC_00872]